jgi:hypothetical protein
MLYHTFILFPTRSHEIVTLHPQDNAASLQRADIAILRPQSQAREEYLSNYFHHSAEDAGYRYQGRNISCIAYGYNYPSNMVPEYVRSKRHCGQLLRYCDGTVPLVLAGDTSEE